MRQMKRGLCGELLSLVFLLLALVCFPVSARAEDFAYSVTPKVNQAALEYMTDMYIKNHPEMGKEICYGSPSDIEVLRQLAEKITAGVSGNGNKAEAIAKWVKRNIEYESMSEYQFPIDVLWARKSNCYGDAYLMQHLMRLSGIPAVVCAGMRGDMKEVVKVSWLNPNKLPDDIEGHAWVYAWYNNGWHLFDPLFDVYDWTKSDAIDSWYCNGIIEGISPSYPGMDMTLLSDAWCVYWVDGHPILYDNGKPFSEAENGVRDTEWGDSAAQYFGGINAFSFPAFYHSDFAYVKDNDVKKAKMVPDEVLSDGWILYGGYPQYVRANGIVVTQTMRQYQGEWLYYTYDGSPLKCSLPIGDISLRYGIIELPMGSSMTLYPDTRENMNAEDKYYYFSTDATDIISIDPTTGKITGLAEGYALAEVIQYSHEEDGMPADERTHWGFSYLYACVVKGHRTFSLEDKKVADDTWEDSQDDTSDDGLISTPGGEPDLSQLSLAGANVKIADVTYTGKALKPAPSVKLGGKTLKKGQDYLVTYQNNVKVGKATAVITGTGSYSGTVKKTFSIKPKKTSLKTLKGGKKKLTVSWKTVKKEVTGYQLQYGTNKKFKKAKTVTIKKAKIKSYVIKKLKSGKTYYVRIRTWKKVSGKKYYSAWSKAKSKKVS